MSGPLDMGAIRAEYEAAEARSSSSAYMADVAGYVPDLLATIEQMVSALQRVVDEDFETGDILQLCRDALALVKLEPPAKG